MTTSNQSSPSLTPRSLTINADLVLFTQVIAIITAVNSVFRLVNPGTEPEKIATIFWIAGIVFLTVEWVLQITRSHNRKAWLLEYRGWMDIVSSLPIPLITLLRPWRVSWLAGRLRSGEILEIERQIVVQRARTTILAVIVAAILVLEFGSILILRTEAGEPGANINTAEDALWWSVVTIATVGYGDKYPVSSDGRTIGTIMIVAGVGLFSSLTSFMAHWFIARRVEPKVQEVGSLPPALTSTRIAHVKDMLDKLGNDPDQEHAEAILTVVTMILESDQGRKSGP